MSRGSDVAIARIARRSDVGRQSIGADELVALCFERGARK